MALWVLDNNFNQMAVIDTFESLIWTDRYYQCGDFELAMPASSDLLTLFRTNEYLVSEFSDNVMVIEGIELESDSENGDKLTITGRSIESILDRRIIWDEINFSGPIQDGILQILNENCIQPSIPDRVIPKMIFDRSNDASILATTMDYKGRGDSVYEAIESICTEKKIGFKIRLSSDNSFLFQLYFGVDRSYKQTSRDIVVFSNDFDNIISSNYIKNSAEYKNVVMIPVSNGDQETIVVVTKNDISYRGLDRRESTMSAESEKSEADLVQDGHEFLNDNSGEELVEGEVDSLGMYRYGVDYFIGDIVELRNDYGLSSAVRVIEYVRSESDSGIEIHPTFEVIDE